MFREKLLENIGGVEHRHLLLALEEGEGKPDIDMCGTGLLAIRKHYGIEKVPSDAIIVDLTTNLQDIPEKDAETICQLLNLK